MPGPIIPIRLNSRDNSDLALQLLFEFSTPERLYILGRSDNFSGSPNLFKSTDSGSTWAVQDESDNPGYNEAVWDVLQVGSVLRVTGAAFASGTSTTALTVTDFDTATDLWGLSGAAGPIARLATPAGARTVATVRVASGDLWVFYCISSGSNNYHAIGYVVNSAGVWGTPTDFVKNNAEANFLQQVVLDSANLIHVIYKKTTLSSMNGSLYHKTVTVGGTQGSEQAIQIPFSPFNFGRAVAWVNPLSSVESIVAPYYDSTSNLAGVWTGTPASAPVWAFTLVDTLGWPAGYSDFGLLQAGRGSAYAFLSGANLYLGWASHDPTYAVVNAMYTAKNDGTGWAAPVLYYDEVANPPSWSGEFIEEPELYANSLLILADSSFASASNINCVGTAFLPPVGGGALSLSCGNPPNGSVGTAYTSTLEPSGGTPPYTFAVTAGALPDGLNLDAATGIISGTPTVANTFGFTVEVTDSLDATADVECSITILEAPDSPPVIICDNPPVGIVGTFYTHDFPASGGTPPYTFAITAGSLPPGLTLNDDTGNISGTPTVNGIFPFTISVTDSGNLTASVSCSITIRKRCLLEQAQS